MNKVGFFRSIHFKFVMVYVLLIMIAMQIIGVYFVKQLERSLLENFNTSITQRINFINYSIEQEMTKERTGDDSAVAVPTLEEDITAILKDFAKDEIQEIRVIDKNSRVIATSDPNNSDIIGKRTTEVLVKRTLVFEKPDEKVLIDRDTSRRVWVSSTPIKNIDQDTIGALYLVASMEEVFSQMRVINGILATGTGLSLAITAVLGVFLARTITRPMSDMRKQAIELSKGNFSRKVKVYGEDEIGQLAITFNNLTDKLEEAQATTEGERKKLASVIAHMTDGVIATNRSGEVILINNPAMEMLNVSRETVYEVPITKLLGIDDEYTFDSLIEQQDSLILDASTLEKPYILRVNFSVIQKEHDRNNGLIAVIYDITEQEKIDQERREFVANVSHELRTPLTTMRSYLEALAEGAWEDKEIAPQFLNVTQNETERMIRLVNDLLQLSKLDSKDYRINKQWINFTNFFNQIIDRFEMTKEQHVTFLRMLPEEKLYVDIDPDKITQVLDNIISNALKYSPEGGLITFKIEVLDDELQISVKDEGMGIPKGTEHKIFERFYRVDKARTRKLGGTGLGLAIAKEMIGAHDGEIWAKSVEGKGTTILFTLPFTQDQEDDWDES
ncbi:MULTISPECIES: cell wall metabolism sensor histidine kinase WalK [Bacillaceae]|uniref:cell wall metabolism sensor histidine kinase WalK n=1 Tax=Bacillaceae TaxID=186817 RepID=UPI000C7946D1|nr:MULTISPECIES: cell wall metabolism sensor histidine kinase WalK [Bacillaceae]PLR67714.1 cell wall metabolism sensor histidine kinase WalK [Bacillus sp. UMB0893]QNG59991.1 cell wall metabolism sensor histidine kinase WalK [Bacillus sp. PAMC26568]